MWVGDVREGGIFRALRANAQFELRLIPYRLELHRYNHGSAIGAIRDRVSRSVIRGGLDGWSRDRANSTFRDVYLFRSMPRFRCVEPVVRICYYAWILKLLTSSGYRGFKIRSAKFPFVRTSGLPDS